LKILFSEKAGKGAEKELTALCVCENKGSFIQVLLRMVLARKFRIPDFVLFINHSTHNISCCMVVSFCFPLEHFLNTKILHILFH